MEYIKKNRKGGVEVNIVKEGKNYFVEKISQNPRTKNLDVTGKKAKNLKDAERIAANYLSKITNKKVKRKAKSDIELLFGI